MLPANNEAPVVDVVPAFDLHDQNDVDVRSRLLNPHDVLTVVEAAQFLKCGPKVVRRLARLRQLPHRKIDRKGTLRFSRAALEAWLREGGR